MAKTINYKKAFDSLKNIFDELQNGEIGVDDLEQKLIKASEYIKICKKILKKQEAKISDILREIEKEE